MKAVKSFEDHFEKNCSPMQRELFMTIRAFIAKNFPGIKEEVKYGMPFYTCNGLVAYFATYARQTEPGIYVGLCQGTLLKDPDQLLIGEGNTVKKMYFNGPEDTGEEGLSVLAGFLEETLFINELKKRKR